ncbi:hypothetical protein EXIGLDRAFT_601956 [Exidia glandulosa HHB12029]|uniref:Thioesterase domain-containing protein n=1 Tax=Exidia glandulosa HHB12029 TaxID=1314781 RepID=A0A165PPT6_EXIGL|nr:hypothetical protein EXIGLDRAFT_601956 [Exidia glandulosa HHB12029]
MVTNTDLFCGSIPPRVRVTHINVLPNPAEPSRVMGQVICELRAERDMVDEHGNVTVGSITYLVDMLSTLALVAQGAQLRKTEDYVAVSQSLQFIFHAPAPLGSTIRLDNTCVALAGRTLTARCEVWDVDANRLICSAFHVKMPPSKPKL